MYKPAFLLALALALALGLAVVSGSSPGQAQPPGKKATERDKALMEAAKDQFLTRWNEYLAGTTTADFVGPWSANWLKAELRLLEKKADKLDAHKAHVERMKKLEEAAKGRFDAGRIPLSQYSQTLYFRLEAEIWLEEFEDKKK